jgi:hypothetical protein
MSVIKSFFRNIEPLNRKYIVFPDKPIHLWAEEDKIPYIELIKQADILLYQPVSTDYGFFASENLMNFLKPGAMTISFPNVYFKGYHPSLTYLKKENSKIDGPFIYHDINIIKGFLEGKPV